MSELQAQCWICPHCHDDKHHEPGDQRCLENVKVSRDLAEARLRITRRAITRVVDDAQFRWDGGWVVGHDALTELESTLNPLIHPLPGTELREARAEAVESAWQGYCREAPEGDCKVLYEEDMRFVLRRIRIGDQ